MKLTLSTLLILLFAMTTSAQCIDTLQFPNLQPPCYPDFIPVCGCDGVTYRNNCYADYATVLQYTDGPCEHVALDFYPNPVVDILYLTVVTKYESDVNLYIFDRNGIVYYYRYLQNITSEQITIPVYGFDKGLYIIMAESNGEIELSKIIRWEQ